MTTYHVIQKGAHHVSTIASVFVSWLTEDFCYYSQGQLSVPLEPCCPAHCHCYCQFSRFSHLSK